MSSVFTLIPQRDNIRLKELDICQVSGFLYFLISGRDFLLELITTDLVTSFQSKKKINFEIFASITAKLKMFLKVDFKFQFEYFFEVLNFHCLIAGSELNNKCLPSQPGLVTAGGKIGKNFV